MNNNNNKNIPRLKFVNMDWYTFTIQIYTIKYILLAFKGYVWTVVKVTIK